MPIHVVEEYWECNICHRSYDVEADALECENATPYNDCIVPYMGDVLAYDEVRESWTKGILIWKALVCGQEPRTHRYQYSVLCPTGPETRLVTYQIKRDGE